MKTRTGKSDGARLAAIGPHAPSEYQVAAARIVVGSAPGSDILLSAASVSRRHAVMVRRPHGYEVTDLGSTNGSFVNGRRIMIATPVRDGDELRFGALRFTFRDFPPAAASRATSAGRSHRSLLPALVLFAAAFAAAFYFAYRRPQERMNLERTTPQASVGEKAAKRVPAGPGAIVGWLAKLNYYRTLVGVAPVSEDPNLSRGDLAHAKYLSENFGERIRRGMNLGRLMHVEERGTPGYSAEGLAAGKSANVAISADPKDRVTSGWAIDSWISAPFHRMSMLNPKLHRVGYGEYCSDGACVAALNIMSDADPPVYGGTLLATPVAFPAKGSVLPLTQFGGEWPDPLSSCSGYSTPAGLAVTLQLGSWITPKLERYSLRTESAAIESCGFDATTYVNPDQATQTNARLILKDYGAVVVIPRARLERGRTYTVAISASGKEYGWKFTVR